jgi:uncharacterized membrane protein YfcA
MNSQLPQGLALIAMSEIVVGSLGIVFSLALFLLNVSDWSAVIACFTLLWILSGFAYLRQKQWAWKLGMVVSLVSLLGSILFFSLVQSFLFFFWPSAIIYLTRPRIKLFVRANAPSTASQSTA